MSVKNKLLSGFFNLTKGDNNMNSFKKMMVKRVIKKNAKELQSIARRTYKDVSKDISKRIATIKMPIRITVSR